MQADPTHVEEIFNEALAKTGVAERTAYLSAVCGGNARLRQRVEALLASHAAAGSFLKLPGLDPGMDALTPLGELPGSKIGSYKLLEQIGEGGFAVVYMAEQEFPVRRKVAFKIIKPGMDSRQVIARFEAERQALAMMDHPNIARVFDAGAMDSGRPYFVMELVKGVPITKYCDEQRLEPRPRLELFIQVCQAVQHAHTKGIIHRDLKPSNVLIALYDGRPVPKVIDFGIAKAMGQQLTDRTLFTGFGAVVGTPEYMSPEQAELNQLDIDTRSDIYSLGVLLYELLTGTTPLEHQRVKDSSLLEVLRVIREEEPPRPSTRLSTVARLPTIAAQRGLEPKKLTGLVRGELDWIVMKALEKDRIRRYETANGLARDVERYLHDEAVLACPPSTTYRLGKFARRNKGVLLAATALAAMLMLLLMGLVVSNVLISAERNQKAAALKEKEEALARAEAQSQRAEASFLRASIAMREVLTKAALGQGEWAGLPVPLRQRLTDEAVSFYQSLLHDGSPDPDLRYETAVGHRSIALLQDRSGRVNEAERQYRQSIAILEELTAAHPDVPRYRHQLAYSQVRLGGLLQRSGQPTEAEARLCKALSLYEQMLAENPDSIDYASELVSCYQSLNALKGPAHSESEAKFYRRRIELLQELASSQPEVLAHKMRLADTLRALRSNLNDFSTPQEIDEAEQKAVELCREVLAKTPASAADSPAIQAAGFTLAMNAFESAQRLKDTDREKAEQAYRQSIEMLQWLSDSFPEMLKYRHELGRSHNWLGLLLSAMRRAEEAEKEHRHAVAIYTGLVDLADAAAGQWHRRELAWSHLNLGELLGNTQRPREAESEFQSALRLCAALADEYPSEQIYTYWLGWSSRQLANYLIGRGMLAEAESLLREALTRLSQRNNGVIHPGAIRLKVTLQEVLRRKGDHAGMETLVAELLNDFDQAIAQTPDDLSLRMRRANTLGDLGKLDEAIAAYSEIIARQPDHEGAWKERGACYLRKGDFSQAVEHFTAAIQWQPQNAWWWHERGYCYLVLGQHDKSIADHSQAIALNDTDAGQRERRGTSYEALGEFEKAEQDYSRAIELAPQAWWAWISRARFYRRQDQPAKARSDLANAARCANEPGAQNGIAWRLVTDPDPSWRDPKLAVELAERAIAAQPGDGMIWNTVGAARYRNGQWKDAILGFEKSMELRNGGDGHDWFFLAMCHWQLGEKDQARKWYDKAVEWTEKNRPQNQELIRFRAEAEELMGLNEDESGR